MDQPGTRLKPRPSYERSPGHDAPATEPRLVAGDLGTLALLLVMVSLSGLWLIGLVTVVRWLV